jgi:DUF4097 and DUF4098 domain-containing protein YvlB
MKKGQCAARLAVVVVLAGTTFVLAETRKEFHFKVGRHASISVINQFGPISVKPSSGKTVEVLATLHSDKVEVDQSQSGDRIDIESHLLPGADAESGRIDYEIQVPSGARVTLHSMTGTLHAENLKGDLTVEGTNAVVDVREVSDAHVHIKTLDGPVTLTNIRDGHVEINSVGGDVMMTSVDGPYVQVVSTSGKIHYDGEFGGGGEYSLSSHTGDIEAVAPSYASIDVEARSDHGKVENDFPLSPRHASFPVRAGSAFVGTVNKAASSVKLRTFSGKIHLKKR